MKTQNPDELGLQEIRKLTTQIAHMSSHLWQSFSTFLRTHILWCLLILIGSLAYFGYQFTQEKPIYTAKAAFVYHELHKKTYGEMTDNLNRLLHEKSYHHVSSLLSLPESSLNALQSIKAVNMHGALLSEDINGDKSPFYVVVTSSETSLFDSLDNVLVQFYNQNPYAKKMISRKKAIIQGEIDRIQSELSILDSIKIPLSHSPHSFTIRNTSIETNPITIFEKTIELNHLLLEKNDVLENYQAVDLLTPFSTSVQQIFRPLSWFISRAILTALAGIILLYILSSIFKKPSHS